ncbi:MAG: hypothetical protein BWY82_03004 [Verrucomicrobia bacterium ADurb.Bin474]|nr:MAG: hypothetical protein BWY82_03004 [Verrucomicrobia bacterium ADurb.Bin474]
MREELCPFDFRVRPLFRVVVELWLSALFPFFSQFGGLDRCENQRLISTQRVPKCVFVSIKSTCQSRNPGLGKWDTISGSGNMISSVIIDANFITIESRTLHR